MRKNILYLDLTSRGTGGLGAPFEGGECSHRGPGPSVGCTLEEIPVLGGRGASGLPSNYEILSLNWLRNCCTLRFQLSLLEFKYTGFGL